ncbi:hypothetical protein E3N88_04648 [Mikania micrantha]|uniref:Transposase-associated domain-containing protein n=1 Tax=Mikania micrantha TaxID=192012 RepID=A0A5N6PXT7_9ASTR|nr:hypothetical protein E3N88_04648 [Mikania micrantha]
MNLNHEVMDRSWMYNAPRSSKTFVNGVKTFLNFPFERTSVNGGKIKCPCTKCLNMKYQSKQSVLDHLICSGFRPEYLKWVYHGEGTTVASTSTTLNEEMHDLLNDAFQPEGRKLHSGVSIHKRRRSSNTEIDEKSLTQAHRYVLFNIEAVTPFRDVPHMHTIGDDGEDGIDITPEMEHVLDFEDNDDDSILF